MLKIYFVGLFVVLVAVVVVVFICMYIDDFDVDKIVFVIFDDGNLRFNKRMFKTNFLEISS